VPEVSRQRGGLTFKIRKVQADKYEENLLMICDRAQSCRNLSTVRMDVLPTSPTVKEYV